MSNIPLNDAGLDLDKQLFHALEELRGTIEPVLKFQSDVDETALSDHEYIRACAQVTVGQGIQTREEQMEPELASENNPEPTETPSVQIEASPNSVTAAVDSVPATTPLADFQEEKAGRGEGQP